MNSEYILFPIVLKRAKKINNYNITLLDDYRILTYMNNNWSISLVLCIVDQGWTTGKGWASKDRQLFKGMDRNQLLSCHDQLIDKNVNTAVRVVTEARYQNYVSCMMRRPKSIFTIPLKLQELFITPYIVISR